MGAMLTGGAALFTAVVRGLLTCLQTTTPSAAPAHVSPSAQRVLSALVPHA